MNTTTLRRLVLLLFIGAWAVAPALGQDGDEVLFDGIQQSGGYGAPTVAITSVAGEAAIVTGGQGGWIINRQFVLGGAGRGVSTRPTTPVDGDAAEVQMGYGGVLLEYISAPSQLVHLGGELLIGAGGAQLRDPDDVDPEPGPDDDDTIDETAFFASEAGARVEVNVTSFFRIGASGGYRLVVGSDLRGVSDADLGGPYGQLSFRFGSF